MSGNTASPMKSSGFEFSNATPNPNKQESSKEAAQTQAFQHPFSSKKTVPPPPPPPPANLFPLNSKFSNAKRNDFVKTVIKTPTPYYDSSSQDTTVGSDFAKKGSNDNVKARNESTSISTFDLFELTDFRGVDEVFPEIVDSPTPTADDTLSQIGHDRWEITERSPNEENLLGPSKFELPVTPNTDVIGTLAKKFKFNRHATNKAANADATSFGFDSGTPKRHSTMMEKEREEPERKTISISDYRRRLKKLTEAVSKDNTDSFGIIILA